MNVRSWLYIGASMAAVGCGGDDAKKPDDTHHDAAAGGSDAGTRPDAAPTRDASASADASSDAANAGPCDPTDWPSNPCPFCDPEDTSKCEVCADDATCDSPTETMTTNTTVTSSCCGLVWQRLPAGITGSDDLLECDQSASSPGCYTWAEAKTYCASLSAAGNQWRLPHVRELLSLLTNPRYMSEGDPNFPDTPSDAFWAALEGWTVDFGLAGRVALGNSDKYYRVRCVSGGN